MIDFKVVLAIFRKDMRQYLSNPTGYVFLTLFIGVTAAAAFLQEGFFARHLADLAELNAVMPAILMIFVPAITMSAWADERRWQTEELMLTAPVRDIEVVLGKYFGVLGMYTISLAFSVAHVAVLYALGEPDSGLMVSTYLGYWLMGAMFCAIGLLASMFSSNATVAFILGALGCGAVVLAGTLPWANTLIGAALIGLFVALCIYVATADAQLAGPIGLLAGVIIPLARLANRFGDEDRPQADPFSDLFANLSVTDHFASFGEGVLRLGDVAYFVTGIVLMIYLAAFMLGRRHW